MSRLEEIKARADAATEGPWVRDMHSPDMSGRSGWYIRGPRKLGLRSMVLNSRMLSGDAEFIDHAREDVPWLIERIGELNGAICWDTTCLNCSSLLDSNYDQYMRAEIAEAEVERLTDLCGEFRKREERLNAEVERLRGWIDRSERQEARARRAEAEVARLTAERDAAIERLERVIDQWRKTGRAVISEMNRAERAEAERDALAAQVARVESLAEEWSTELDENRCPAHAFPGCDCHEGYHHAWDDLRAALAGPTALDAMGADQ